MKRETKILVVVSAASGMSAFDLTLMFVAYPEIRASFPDVPNAQLSWVLTSFTIVAASLLIPAGRLADRIGRRKVFLVSITLFSTGSLLVAVAPSVPLLIAARIVQACGGAMLTPSALAIIMGNLPPERRATAVGVWAVVTSAVASAAPTLGALVISAGSWRWAFALITPVGLVCFVLARRLLEPSPVGTDARIPDPLGALLIMVGVATLALGIVQSNDWGWTGTRTMGAFVASAVLLAVLVWRCTRHPTPVIDLSVFRAPLFRADAVAAAAVGVAYWGAFYVFVQFLTKGWGYSIGRAGLLLTPMTLASTVVGIPAGRLMDRYGHRALMVPAGLAFSVALLWLRAAAGDDRDLGLWFGVALLVGAANAILFPGVNSAAARTAPIEKLGLTAGVIQTVIRIGGTAGAALGVALIGDVAPGGSVSEFHSAMVAVAIAGLIATAAAIPLATGPRRLGQRGLVATRSPGLEPG